MQCYILAFLIPFASFSMLNASLNENKEQNVIILFGPPASGKGTQAARIADTTHLPHISTGDLFRENIRDNTPLGRKAKEYIDQGKLVPDSLVLEILYDRLAKNDTKNGFILDGVPRTLEQANALENYLSSNAALIVLNLIVSDDTILKRALGRKRTDDTPEVIKERLRAYYNQTAPLIDFYRKKGVLINIDGEKSPDDVFNKLTEILKERLGNNCAHS